MIQRQTYLLLTPSGQHVHQLVDVHFTHQIVIVETIAGVPFIRRKALLKPLFPCSLCACGGQQVGPEKYHVIRLLPLGFPLGLFESATSLRFGEVQRKGLITRSTDIMAFHLLCSAFQPFGAHLWIEISLKRGYYVASIVLTLSWFAEYMFILKMVLHSVFKSEAVFVVFEIAPIGVTHCSEIAQCCLERKWRVLLFRYSEYLWTPIVYCRRFTLFHWTGNL